MGKSGSGKSSSSSKTHMTAKDAARIQSAGDRNPKSDTSKSGFVSRAQSAADKSTHQEKK